MKTLTIKAAEPSAAAPRSIITVRTEEEKGDLRVGQRLTVVRDYQVVCTGQVKEIVQADAHRFVLERDDDGREFLGLRPGDSIEVQL